MKKLLNITLLSFIVVFVLSSCSKDDSPAAPTETANEAAAKKLSGINFTLTSAKLTEDRTAEWSDLKLNFTSVDKDGGKVTVSGAPTSDAKFSKVWENKEYTITWVGDTGNKVKRSGDDVEITINELTAAGALSISMTIVDDSSSSARAEVVGGNWTFVFAKS